MSSFIVALSCKENKILPKIGKATHSDAGTLATCQTVSHDEDKQNPSVLHCSLKAITRCDQQQLRSSTVNTLSYFTTETCFYIIPLVYLN